MSNIERKWPIFRGDNTPHTGIEGLPPPPPWRAFPGVASDRRLPNAPHVARFEVEETEINWVTEPCHRT